MFRSPLFPIFLTVFVDVLGLTLVLPLLPFYAEHYGASPFVVTTLAASYALCQLVSGPVLGRISDRVGRKPTLLVSQCGTFIGFLVLGSAHTLWMLFLGRIIDGITAGNLTIAQAYVSDVTRPEDRTRAFGFIGIAFGTGFLIGPALSGVLARHFGYGAPAFGAAGLSLMSIVATAVLLPRVAPRPAEEAPPAPSRPAEGAAAGSTPVVVEGAAPVHRPADGRARAFRHFFTLREPRRRLIEFFCFALSFSTLIGGLALFLERRFLFDVEKTGYVYALSGAVGALVQGGVLGRLSRRFGDDWVARVGFASMAIGYGLLGGAFVFPMLVVLVVISGFGSAVTRPALTTLLTKSVGRQEQGAALGVSQSLASIAQVVGNLSAGALIEGGFLASWAALAAFYALAGFFISMQRRGRRFAPTSAPS